MPGVRLLAMTCGWLESELGLFLAGEPGRIRVPVPAFLVEHPRGRVLFDTGLHPDTATDPVGRLGPGLAAAFAVSLAPGEDVVGRLAALGVDPAGIDWIVSSHLHFDHTGGNVRFPDARWLLQRREWEAHLDPERRARSVYDPRDYDLGHERVLVDGEHDLFGDGTVVCLPTFGHTDGHQSLRVRLAGGDVVLTADACYLRRALEDLHLPPAVADAEASLASLRRLRALEAGGARLVFGHDPATWADVPQAPTPLEAGPA